MPNVQIPNDLLEELVRIRDFSSDAAVSKVLRFHLFTNSPHLRGRLAVAQPRYDILEFWKHLLQVFPEQVEVILEILKQHTASGELTDPQIRYLLPLQVFRKSSHFEMTLVKSEARAVLFPGASWELHCGYAAACEQDPTWLRQNMTRIASRDCRLSEHFGLGDKVLGDAKWLRYEETMRVDRVMVNVLNAFAREDRFRAMFTTHVLSGIGARIAGFVLGKKRAFIMQNGSVCITNMSMSQAYYKLTGAVERAPSLLESQIDGNLVIVLKLFANNKRFTLLDIGVHIVEFVVGKGRVVKKANGTVFIQNMPLTQAFFKTGTVKRAPHSEKRLRA